MPNPDPSPAAWPLPRWIAHRGAGRLAPENTLAAFRLGARHGYRAFECDVKLSADGVPFLLHDTTLERTSNGLGRAGDLRWSQLALLDAGSWHGRQHAGEPLATLAGVAAFILRNRLALNIELKPVPGQERLTGEVVAAEAARLWAGSGLPPPLLSSFSPVALEGARQAAPGLPRALLLDALHEDWPEVARGLGVQAVITDHRLMDADVLAVLRAQRWRGLCYTVNETEDVQRLLALGIDGLITDAIDRHAPD